MSIVFYIARVDCLFSDCLVDEFQMLPDGDVEEHEEELELPNKGNK